VEVTDKFVYLGSTVDSTGYSNTEILRLTAADNTHGMTRRMGSCRRPVNVEGATTHSRFSRSGE